MSVGVVLVASPLVGIYSFLKNFNQILIRKTEYNLLTKESLCFLQWRNNLLLNAFDILPWFYGFLMLTGIACLVYGSFKWFAVQKELDEQIKLKTQEQQLNIKQMSSVEVVEKAMNEVALDTEVRPTEPVNKQHYSGTRFMRLLRVEQQCYEYLTKKLSCLYNVYQNVKVGVDEFDIVAVSQKDNIDLLYEVKFYLNGLLIKNLRPVLIREEEKGK